MEFGALSRRLSPTIKRIAYRLNGKYRSFGHEDLYQEALMHLWSSFTKGRLKSKTDSYILQGCYFHLKNYIRKVNDKPHTSLDELILSDSEGLNLKDALIDKSAKDIRDLLDFGFLAEAIKERGRNIKEKGVLEWLSKGLTTREIGRKVLLSHVMVVRIIGKIRKRCLKNIK